MHFHHTLHSHSLRRLVLLLALLCGQLAVLGHEQKHLFSGGFDAACEFCAAGTAAASLAALPTGEMPAFQPALPFATESISPLIPAWRSPRLSQGPPRTA